MNSFSIFSLKLTVLVTGIILFLLFFTVRPSFAATLASAKDTVTTSRPSPSSPNDDTAPGAAASSSQLTIYNNGSRFLASDSARVIRTSTTGIINSGLIVSSQSAALTTIFLGNSTSALTQKGTDVVYVPITAMHTVQFITSQTLDTGDDIVLTFPTLTSGDSNNPASPSATTFQMNNIGTSQIKVEDDGGNFTTFTATVTNPSAGTSPIISLNVDSGTIAPGSVVKVYLGCDTWSGAACSVQAPRIINPTKNSNTTCTGSPETCTATSWKLRIDAIDSATSNTDTATVGIATIESVTVRATVDPTLTFTITGLANGVSVNTSNAGCSDNETTNSGIASSANETNLGVLSNTPAIDTKLANITGQRIDISTNGPTGYALTATSSSSLLNPQTGYFLKASTTPSAFPVQDDFFGLHACGQDVVSGFVESGASSVDCDTHVTGSAANECYYAWPTNSQFTSTTPLSIATDTSGPIGAGSPDASGDGSISISYAAGADVSVPPGEYRAIITYIATPSF